MFFKMWLKKLMKYLSEADARADRIQRALIRQKEHDVSHFAERIYF